MAATSSSRLEAFSDGVIAIIITIMVLELKAPHEASWQALLATWPTFVAYALSFIVVAVYWINHHHLLHLANRVGTEALWANINWLFWLSLIPITTAFLGDTQGSPLATSIYSILSIITGASFGLFQHALIKNNKDDGALRANISGRHKKTMLSIAIMILAIPIAYIALPIAFILLALPPLLHFLPDL